MGFVFRGGHLALDFLNTEVRTATGEPADLLVDPAALRQWFVEVGLSAGNGPDVSPELLVAARVFRAALRAVIAARVAGLLVPPEALAGVNDVLREGTGYAALEASGGDLRHAWKGVGDAPRAELLPVAATAVELLTGEQASYIRQCGNPECILYFLDTSKNHTRRWCSMEACGNRRKAAAHYRRKKEHAHEGNPPGQ